MLRADKLEHIVKQYDSDKAHMHKRLSECIISSKQLAMRCEEALRQGNNLVRKETEDKMCKFTENLILEFKYLNKRLEDKILFTVGYYQEMPPDERNPVLPNIKITKHDYGLVSRPKSALPLKLNFDEALSRATESAGDRLKLAY